MIKLSEPNYIKKLLDCYDMFKAKTAKVLMQDTILLLFDTSISELEKTKYPAKVASIMYVMVKTCIDIVFAISIISQCAKKSELGTL